ncbi:DUF1501 domain-containing protein [Pseudoalteromonas sp. S16_S37]|uniref:DUF1501 domain-containing protein n=1 Tax=Pseudoalteromonas sp. S16_S37 TaxID=2720228 RepID=UPI0016814288|nr:DUF1501 domain-containing protein [Pseudoalteromonas sp. S16_S37]MBD1583508.1 DUF1501 domain-containing protein [Pseudoalteromonas sp. S16_S37]
MCPTNGVQLYRQFALPPEMSNMAKLYQQGRLSVVGNVGPLIEPTNATTFKQESAKLPLRLFSHNDQQSIWLAGQTEGAQFGWAGKLNDALIAQGTHMPNTFSAITTAGSGLLIAGDKTTPYHVSNGRAANIEIFEEFDESNLLKQHFSAITNQGTHFIEQDVASQMNSAFDANQKFNAAMENTQITLPSFGNSDLGKQLETVSKAIAIREQLNEKRQVFFVAMGGFDTHSDQANSLPQLQQTMDESISVFDQAMQKLGLSDSVTLFTASDFGRTLVVNGDGTDHGWGGHHFIMGGAINGGTIFGDIPEPVLDHTLDAGHGRLIPTMSVEQYAASLGAWLGVEQQTLRQIFRTLANFGDLPNMFKK